MATVEDMKDWIDRASYQQLLGKWRFAPVGDPYFTTPEVYEHFQEAMKRKRAEVGDGGHVAASKSLGW